MRNIDSDLIRGNIDTIILKTMLEEDKYGLDIIKEVEERSSGTYELKQPTLYSCLKRLENQQLISSYWQDSDIGGRRHYYKLTDKGREFYAQKQEEWAKSKFIIDNLLSNYDYEEYRLVKKDEYDQIKQDKEHLSNSVDASQSSINSEVESAMSDNTMSDTISEIDDETTDNNEEIQEPVQTKEPESLDELLAGETYDELVSIINKFNYKSPEDAETSNATLSDSDFNFSMDEHFDDEHEHDEDFEENISEKFEKEDEDLEYQTHDFFSDEQTEIVEDSDEEVENTIDEIEEEAEEDNSPVYFEQPTIKDVIENQTNTVTYEQADQTNNELNILRSLHAQEDEEINTYYGDQKSYVNHLNTDFETHQENLLDDSLYANNNDINETINNFNESISKLNNFNAEKTASKEEIEQEDFSLENSEIRDEFHNDDSHEWSHDDIEEPETDELDELKELNPNLSTGFFKSYDDTDYTKTSTKEIINSLNKTEDIYSDETDSSDAAFEEVSKHDPYEDYFSQKDTYFENVFGPTKTNETEEDDTEELTYNFGGYEEEPNLDYTEENDSDLDPVNYSPLSQKETCNIVSRETSSADNFEARNPDCFIDFRANTDHKYEQTNFDDIDKIISNNATTTFSYDDAIFAPIDIKPTQNYKEKLSGLSTYSKVSLDEEQPQRNNEEALMKAKDIAELTKEFEQEGIVVKEHYKNTTSKSFDRSYLLTNKIQLIKSMILFFGYVFLLSAVYIVLNNTGFKDTFGFSIKYFLYGFIPFAVIMLYRIAMYFINPYKKSPAKYASRIMVFISIIIAIQLLLITYCVNLQLGFYSFAQKGYNHLLWLIPTIISFAPIIDNLIYMALYNSKNFHV